MSFVCGRFEAGFSKAELEDIVRAAQQGVDADEMTLLKTQGEIKPTDVFPVMTGVETFRPMSWGFSGEGIKNPIINARSETVLEKPMFRNPILRHRCVVLCDAFYEWKQHKEKHIYRMPGGGRMYLAAIWRMERSSNIPRFTILTRDAVGDQLEVHPRIPVVIPPELIYTWIAESAKIQEIIGLAMTELTVKSTVVREPTLFDMVDDD